MRTQITDLSEPQLMELIHGEGLSIDLDDVVELTLTNRRSGSELLVKLTRAVQLQRCGAAGWWVAVRLPGERLPTGVASYASAEPMRGWAWQTHRRLRLHQQEGDCAARLRVVEWLCCYVTMPHGLHHVLRGCSVDAVVHHSVPWGGLQQL